MAGHILFKLRPHAFSSGIMKEPKAEQEISTSLKTLEGERTEKIKELVG